MGRVEMWRGGCRLNISVAASFVWWSLSGSTMTPFPRPAHRTGQADFPHPALGQDVTPLLSRATPSAVSEHLSELIGCPISRSLTTCCVSPEPRPLPSTGITRLQRYYGPLRHPKAPGPSLAGVRLAIVDHAVGLPVLRALPLCTCRRHYPGAVTGRFVCSLPQSCQPSPQWQAGRPARRLFRGLLGVHSRCGLHTRAATVIRGSHSKGFNRFVNSTVAPVASGWSYRRVGLSPTGKRRLITAHATLSHSTTRNARR